MAIGDIDLIPGTKPAKEDQLLQNEEIDAMIKDEPTLELAATYAAESIAARFTRLADKSVDGLRQSFSQKAKQYFALADRLRQRAPVSARFGGQTKSGKRALQANEDAVQPPFRIGQHDHPQGPDQVGTELDERLGRT